MKEDNSTIITSEKPAQQVLYPCAAIRNAWKNRKRVALSQEIRDSSKTCYTILIGDHGIFADKDDKTFKQIGTLDYLGFPLASGKALQHVFSAQGYHPAVECLKLFPLMLSLPFEIARHALALVITMVLTPIIAAIHAAPRAKAQTKEWYNEFSACMHTLYNSAKKNYQHATTQKSRHATWTPPNSPVRQPYSKSDPKSPSKRITISG